MGDIGLRLVVIVIGHEILHGVVGKKLLELRAELGRQGLVVGQYQRRPLDSLDDLGHGKGLSGASDAQQHLLLQSVLDALRQLGNSLGLVAGGLVFRYNLKIRHFTRSVRSSIRGRPLQIPAGADSGWCHCNTALLKILHLFDFSQQVSGIRKGDKVLIGHDDVIGQRNTHRGQGLFGPVRSGVILR